VRLEKAISARCLLVKCSALLLSVEWSKRVPRRAFSCLLAAEAQQNHVSLLALGREPGNRNTVMGIEFNWTS
jgi:hypothetical protein